MNEYDRAVAEGRRDDESLARFKRRLRSLRKVGKQYVVPPWWMPAGGAGGSAVSVTRPRL